ncbi:MAG: PIN domain nuclease [Thermoprotei archaeon]|nr:MAG: PIN domain nuclease [Thermoprotei archaeon]
MIVVDASALAKYILKEDNWRNIREVLEEESVSLDHVVKEVANAIWKRSVVLNQEPPDVARTRLQLLKRLVNEGIVGIENELEYLDKAFEIAVENGITVYDALYIAQAIAHRAELLTSDKKQAEVAKRLGLKVRYVP